MTHLALATLDSVLTWGGVIDELDYMERLQQWWAVWQEKSMSDTLKGVLKADARRVVPQTVQHAEMKETCQEVTEDVQVDDLAEDRPSANQTGGNQSHVEEVMEKQKSEDNEEDCYCLPPMIGLAVAQFHDLGEVQSNALRICLATHRSKEAREGATKLATLIARLLQGKALEEVVALGSCLEGLDLAHPVEEDEKITGGNGNLPSGCFAILRRVVTAVPEFNGNGFKGALSKVRLGILSNIL